MKARERLVRHAGYLKIGLAAYLLGAGWLMSAYPFGFVIRFVFAVVSLAIVAAAFWSLFEMPCPACRKPLGAAGFKIATRASRASEARCPHCAQRLDDAP
ncbi:MAG TPA: hypothetical protein VGI93_18225 [Steroidobacteraceae bacterium]|jgi:hypothetical protein